MTEISPIVIAPLREPATAATELKQSVFQQQQINKGSTVKSTVLQNTNITTMQGKNIANVTITVAGSPVMSGQQSSLVLNVPRQKLSNPPNVQGYEAKVVPRLTPRPSHNIFPRFTARTQPAVNKQITQRPILHGPRTPALSQNRSMTPASFLQNEVMNQLLANPTTAMATFLQNTSGSAIATTPGRPPNAISQRQTFPFPTTTAIPSTTLAVTSLVAPMLPTATSIPNAALPVTSLVAPTLPTLNAVSNLNLPSFLPSLNTQIPGVGRIPFPGPEQGTNAAIITSGLPMSCMNSPGVAGQTLSGPQVLRFVHNLYCNIVLRVN